MRNYSIPPDMNEKEKVIGGILDLHQFFWILGGLLIGAIVFVLLFPIFGKASLFFGILFSLSGIPFVVIKKEGLTLFEYLKRKKAFENKTKYLPNKRKNCNL